MYGENQIGGESLPLKSVPASAAIILGKLRGTEPTCDCGSGGQSKKKGACC